MESILYNFSRTMTLKGKTFDNLISIRGREYDSDNSDSTR